MIIQFYEWKLYHDQLSSETVIACNITPRKCKFLRNFIRTYFFRWVHCFILHLVFTVDLCSFFSCNELQSTMLLSCPLNESIPKELMTYEDKLKCIRRTRNAQCLRRKTNLEQHISAISSPLMGNRYFLCWCHVVLNEARPLKEIRHNCRFSIMKVN